MGFFATIAGSGGGPGTPTIGTATAGNTNASVAFTVPAYTGKGGAVVYRAISTPSNIEGTASSSPITVSGLSNGTSYTFQVRTETSYGANSAYSAASNSVTPVAPTTTTTTTPATTPATTGPPTTAPPTTAPPTTAPPTTAPPTTAPPTTAPPTTAPPTTAPPCTGCPPGQNAANVTGICPQDPSFLATFYTTYDSCGEICTQNQVGQCFN